MYKGQPAWLAATSASPGRRLQNSLEYHFFAGLDYNLLPVVSWRVIELGYGGLDAGGHNYPIANISTGIVFRFGGH